MVAMATINVKEQAISLRHLSKGATGASRSSDYFLVSCCFTAIPIYLFGLTWPTGTSPPPRQSKIPELKPKLSAPNKILHSILKGNRELLILGFLPHDM